MELSGKHVVITGGSRGIGAAMARAFAIKGAKLTLVARSEDALRKVANEVMGNAVVADLSDDSVVDTLIQRIESEYGPIDVLVNNAGLDTSTPFAVEDPREIRAVSRLNLETPMLLTRHVLPGMVQRNSGHIVFVSSLAGTAGFPGMSAYCGTKAGIFNFNQSLRRELQSTGVNTTVLSPGPVDTQMWDNVEDSVPSVQRVVKRFQRLQLIPTAKPEDIAQRTVAAVVGNKPYVRDPKRLSINFWLNAAPSRISNFAAMGVKFDPMDRGTKHN
jgi:short-subunit dehydrogenase